MDDYINKVSRNMAVNLAALRTGRRMSQADLATAAGIPRSTGRSTPGTPRASRRPSGGPPASGAIRLANMRIAPTPRSATETYVPNVRRRAIERSRSAGRPRCWSAVKQGSLEHLPGSVKQDRDEEPSQDLDVDPVGDPRTEARAEEHTDRGRRRDVGVDAAAEQVDDRARRRRDADHQVARRRGDAERHAHDDVHHGHLDEPATDPQERGRDPRHL